VKKHLLCAAALGILFTLSFASPAMLRAQTTQQAAPAKKQFTIEGMFSREESEKAPQFLQWSPDGKKLSYVTHGAAGEGEALYYFDPATGKSAVLVAADRLASLAPPTSGNKDDRQKDNRARYGVAAYQWAPNSKAILFDQLGQLWYYDLTTQRGTQITNSDEPSTDPKLSPDGRFISYVRNHNLLLRPVERSAEIALTRDKDENLLNGEVDWLYSEELDVRSNYFWSPDSRQIVYIQMNETEVPTYPIVDWVPLQPAHDAEKYPKPGEINPGVKLAVTDLEGHTRWITLTKERDIYIPRFGWLKPGIAWALVLNRAQDKEDLYFIDTNTGASKLALTEQDEQYIELHDGLSFFEESGRFLWPSWRDGHTHLYLYSYDWNAPLSAPAKLEKQITRGDWEVQSLSGVDEKAGVVYFTANKNDDRQSQLYSVKLDGSAPTQVSQEKGSHDIEMSKDATHYTDSFSTMTTAPRISICQISGPCYPVYKTPGWERYESVLIPEFVDFKAEDGTVLRGILLLPPKGAPAEVNGKFPLILNPYGGPHAQTVADHWGHWGAMTPFDEIMAQRGFAILKVDNRGMNARGKKFATATRGNLGEVELRDQLAALDQVLARYPQLDGSRLGWWGWSYGGTMTLDAMTHSARFKAGVAVAPVTDWRLYDSTYTERYMGLPKENSEGYKRSSMLLSAPNLSGRLLIVHGTSDDNVHMQNTIQFIYALQEAGKPFDMQLYPRKTHSISGRATRTHLYHRIQKHFEDALMKP
jgi:dipeptidyl-peptidase-4